MSDAGLESLSYEWVHMHLPSSRVEIHKGRPWVNYFIAWGWGSKCKNPWTKSHVVSPNWMLDFPGGICCGQKGDWSHSSGTGVMVAKIWETERSIRTRAESWMLNLGVRVGVRARSKASKWKSRRKWRKRKVPRVCWCLQWLVTKDYYGDWGKAKGRGNDYTAIWL